MSACSDIVMHDTLDGVVFFLVSRFNRVHQTVVKTAIIEPQCCDALVLARNLRDFFVLLRPEGDFLYEVKLGISRDGCAGVHDSFSMKVASWAICGLFFPSQHTASEQGRLSSTRQSYSLTASGA